MAALLTPTRRGHSLVELLLGAVVFMLGLVVLLGLFPASSKALLTSQSRLVASRLAQGEMERTLEREFYEMSDDEREVVVRFVHNGTQADLAYSVAVDVTELAKDKLKKIRVDVRWEGGARGSSLSLETEVANYL